MEILSVIASLASIIAVIGGGIYVVARVKSATEYIEKNCVEHRKWTGELNDQSKKNTSAVALHGQQISAIAKKMAQVCSQFTDHRISHCKGCPGSKKS